MVQWFGLSRILGSLHVVMDLNRKYAFHNYQHLLANFWCEQKVARVTHTHFGVKQEASGRVLWMLHFCSVQIRFGVIWRFKKHAGVNHLIIWRGCGTKQPGIPGRSFTPSRFGSLSQQPSLCCLHLCIWMGGSRGDRFRMNQLPLMQIALGVLLVGQGWGLWVPKVAEVRWMSWISAGGPGKSNMDKDRCYIDSLRAHYWHCAAFFLHPSAGDILESLRSNM